MELQLNTEAEFDVCVKAIGGIKVSELYEGAPSFDNADYLFENYGVVAELKCLSEDKGADNALQEKTELIIRGYLDESPLVVFGRCRINTDQLSPNCTKEIAELYRKPIRGVMRKANKQIRETKRELKLDDAHGLLILVNDKNTAVDPSRISWILAETFKRDGFSSINSVLFVTLNLAVSHPAIENDLLVWVEGYRDANYVCPQALYDELRYAVYSRWEVLMGQEIQPIEVRSLDFIHELEYKKT